MVEFGLPCGPVQDIAQVAKDPQMAARDMFIEVPHPVLGSVKMAGNPIKMSRTPAEPKGAPPVLGEHSGDVLSQLLGVSQEQVDALRAEGVIG